MPKDTDIRALIGAQRDFYHRGMTRTYETRIEALKKLKRLIKENERDILKALNLDLGKSYFESYITEYALVISELDFAIKNLKKWMKAKKVSRSLFTITHKSFYTYEPLGVNLIISPWNYPFFLSFGPVVGALAAGNTIILKSSSKSKAMTRLINKLINENFDKDLIYHLDNEKIDYDELIGSNFDHILYTGGPGVALRIKKAQADKFSKLTLELGGKSPCLVDKSADIKMAAKKIAWAKTVNAGQTCIAPDYILADSKIKDELIGYLKFYLREFYGDNPLTNEDYPRIINKDHFERIGGLIDSDKLVHGGRSDERSLKIEPSIMDGVDFSDKVMGEEIFGPIIPIISYDDIKRVFSKLKTLPKPLAFYTFSEDKKIISYVVNNMDYGNGAINDCLLQISNPKLEFGGVGMSGLGGYHGYFGFMNFSNRKSMVREGLFDNFLRYPPHNEKKFKFLRKILD